MKSKTTAAVKKAHQKWVSDRDKLIAQIIELEPRFDAVKLEDMAKDSGLSAMYQLRDDLNKVANLLANHGK